LLRRRSAVIYCPWYI